MAGQAASVLYLHSSAGRYGADRQLQLIAAGLDPHRYRPLVVVPAPGPLVEDLRAAGVEVLIRDLAVIRRQHISPAGLAGLGERAARDAAGLARLISSRGVALVHSNSSVVIGGAAAAALTRRPHVWHIRELYSRFARWWPLYRRILCTAAALPCISEATAGQFEGRGRTQVIYDGLAVSVRPADRSAARAALGLDEQQPVIAILGRISDWKGQDVLVRALAEPPLRERGAIGLIAGDAWPGAEDRAEAVRSLAEVSGVSERLRMIGFRDDLDMVLGSADLIAVPSTAPEPLGGVAIEAAAAGCAVIAAAHGGLPEVIRDGETGRLVAPGDPGALAQAAAALLDDPAERERLRSAAAADVRKRFAPERLLGQIQALYDRLLS